MKLFTNFINNWKNYMKKIALIFILSPITVQAMELNTQDPKQVDIFVAADSNEGASVKPSATIVRQDKGQEVCMHDFNFPMQINQDQRVQNQHTDSFSVANRQIPATQQVAQAALAQTRKRKNPESHAKVAYSVTENEKGNLIFKRQKLEAAKSSSSNEVEKKSRAETGQLKIVEFDPDCSESDESCAQDSDSDESDEEYVRNQKQIEGTKIYLCPAPQCFLKFDRATDANKHYKIHTNFRKRLTDEIAQILGIRLEPDPDKSKNPKDYQYFEGRQSQCPVPSCQAMLNRSSMHGHVSRIHLKPFGLDYKPKKRRKISWK